jgi:hypothetical protein
LCFSSAISSSTSPDSSPAGAAGLERGLLRREHCLVEGSAGAREAAAHRVGASDVGSVALEFAARVDQHQLLIAQLLVVGDVVEHGGVGASAHDRRVGGAARAPTPKGVLDNRLELVFVGTAVRQTSRLAVRLGADGSRASHHVELGGFLDQAHLVHDAARIDDGLGRRHALPGAPAQVLDRLRDPGVDAKVATEHVIDALGLAYQLRDVLEELIFPEGLVGAVVAQGALGARSVAGPDLGGGVARLDVERVAGAVVGAQHGGGTRVVEAGQVPEVAILPEGVGGVVRTDHERRAEEDRDGARAHGFADLLAALGEHGAILPDPS